MSHLASGGADSRRQERVALGPYPTTASIRSKIQQARDARDAANKAVLKLVAASLAAGARLSASFVRHWVAQRLARQPRSYDTAYSD